jgi:hypothetical protein
MKTVVVAMFVFCLSAKTVSGQSDISDLIPIDDLGSAKYAGYTGGLYPNGGNTAPPSFLNDAIAFANSIKPLNSKGSPDNNGKIGLVTIGASTVAMFSDGIEKLIYEIQGLNPAIVFVNGGIGGQDLNKIYDQQGKYWLTVESRVRSAGLSNAQVQVVWLQEDDLKDQSAAFPGRAEKLADDFTYVVQNLKIRYPNLKFVYLTARHTTLWMPEDAKAKHKEPRAYINGWATKFFIERQINGAPELAYKGEDAKSPMLLWGPYFWTQGDKPRNDGYTFSNKFLNADGVHPNELGKIKVAKDILDFWANDPVSQLWFLANPASVQLADVKDNQPDVLPDSYLRLFIMGSEIEKIDRTKLTGNIRLLFLQDTTVVSNATYLTSDSINITGFLPGTYTYVLKDEADFISSARFAVGEDLIARKVDTQMDKKPKNLVGPDEPAWFINGQNKLPKLIRILGGDQVVNAVFTTPDGTVVLTVEDALHKHTNVNELIASGQYVLTFYDVNGNKVDVQREIPEYIRIK